MKKLFTLFAAALFATNISAQVEVVYLDNILVNGDLEGEETEGFWYKTTADNVPEDAFECTIEDGVGYQGTRGIKVTTLGQESLDWAAQFWIVSPQALEEGETWRISFDIKANVDVNGISTQAHQGPAEYNHYECAGSFDVKTDWKRIELTFTVTNNMVTGSGHEEFKAICLNISPGTSNEQYTPSANPARTYYFDNFALQKVIIPKPVWMNVIPNGDCEADPETGLLDESTNLYSFIGKNFGNVWKVAIVDGLGVDGSRCAVVESGANPEQAWDTQFFISTSHQFEVGERVKVKFDYRADLEDGETVNGDLQIHAEPGNYIANVPKPGGNWWESSSVDFTNAWDTYEIEWTVTSSHTKPAEGKYMQSIGFNLNKNKEKAIKFYFDNMKLFVDEPNATYDDFAMNEKIDEIATGVKNLKAQKNAKNVRVNLAGQQVDSNYKGFVIENGKKFVIK